MDKLSANTGIAGKFVNNEIISIHGFKPVISSTRDGPTQHAKVSEVNVFQLSQSFALDDPIVRSLVSESSSIFYNLQTAKTKSCDIYLGTSRAYRSAIRTTLTKLQDAITGGYEEPEYVQKLENFMTIFYTIECLWHLCEILLIDQASLSVVVNLLEWVIVLLTLNQNVLMLSAIVDEVPLPITESERS